MWLKSGQSSTLLVRIYRARRDITEVHGESLNALSVHANVELWLMLNIYDF